KTADAPRPGLRVRGAPGRLGLGGERPAGSVIPPGFRGGPAAAREREVVRNEVRAAYVGEARSLRHGGSRPADRIGRAADNGCGTTPSRQGGALHQAFEVPRQESEVTSRRRRPGRKLERPTPFTQ